MYSRRKVLGALTLLTAPALAGCGGRRPPPAAPAQLPASSFIPSPAPRPDVAGLDAVIDISHNVTVTDFAAVRRSSILGVIHKVTEGGDWLDPSYRSRRPQAEAAGLRPCA